MYKQYRETLINNGYTPLPIAPNDKRPSPGLFNWTSDRYKPPTSPEYDNASVGLRCGDTTSRIVGIDADIEHEDAATELYNFIKKKYPSVLVRTGRHPRRMYVFRSVEPVSGIRSKKTGIGSTVIWGKGRQFVAFGLHPATGKPYVWEDDRSPLTVGAATLPILTTPNAQIIVDKANELCLLFSDEIDAPLLPEAQDPIDEEIEAFAAEITTGATEEDIEFDLSKLNPDMGRDDWIRVLMAVHHETGGSPTGMQLVDEWSAKGFKYVAGEVEKYWNGFRGKLKPVTYATVKQMVSEVTKEQVISKTPVLWSVNDYSVSRLLSAPVKPREFIVPGFLAKRTVGFVFGEGGSFKSLAMLHLVIYRALSNIIPELKWLDTISMAKSFGKSIFISAEDGIDDLQRRVVELIERISAEYDVDRGLLLKTVSENVLILAQEDWLKDKHWFLFDSMTPYSKDTASKNKGHALIRLVKDFGADLVVLETLSRMFNVNENDNREAARVVSLLEKLRNVTYASLLVVAHSSKQTRSGDSDQHGQNGMRGASAFMDNARFGLRFLSLGDESAGTRLKIRHAKAWNCPRHPDIEVIARYPDFTTVVTKPPENAEQEVKLRGKVALYIQSNPGCTITDIQTATRSRVAVIRTALRTLIESGMVTKHKQTGTKTIVYEVVAWDDV